MSEERRNRLNRTAVNSTGPRRIIDLLGGSKSWDLLLEEWLNKDFVVTSINPTRHASKDVAIADVTTEDGAKVMLITSTVIAAKLLELKAELPLLCKVGRKGKRYHFIT